MAYEGIREITEEDTDEIRLDSAVTAPLLWSKTSRNNENALSQPQDKADKDKADKAWKDKAALNERKTFLCDDFWEDFVLMSKVCLLRDSEADLYDVFETIRTRFLGGWGYTKASLEKMDKEIELEYQKSLR